MKTKPNDSKLKVVLILSGGVDSTTLLHFMISQPQDYEAIHAISFDYGQRHKKELEYARKTCEKLGIKHDVIDITNITKYISNSALTGDKELPKGDYNEDNMRNTVVPNRNMIMLSIAIGIAENMNYDCVAIANHAGDHHIYPDCRPAFIRYLGLASTEGTYNKIFLYAPFTDLTKEAIMKMGKRLGIDYDAETWSCYEGGDVPCGKCGTCRERIEAMK